MPSMAFMAASVPAVTRSRRPWRSSSSATWAWWWASCSRRRDTSTSAACRIRSRPTASSSRRTAVTSRSSRSAARSSSSGSGVARRMAWRMPARVARKSTSRRAAHSAARPRRWPNRAQTLASSGMPRTWRRTTEIVRSVTRASRIGADTYTATLRRLVWSLAVQFMNADASAHTTMQRALHVGGQALAGQAEPQHREDNHGHVQGEGLDHGRHVLVLDGEDEPVLRREHDVQQASVQQGQQGHPGRDQAPSQARGRSRPGAGCWSPGAAHPRCGCGTGRGRVACGRSSSSGLPSGR